MLGYKAVLECIKSNGHLSAEEIKQSLLKQIGVGETKCHVNEMITKDAAIGRAMFSAITSAATLAYNSRAPWPSVCRPRTARGGELA